MPQSPPSPLKQETDTRRSRLSFKRRPAQQRPFSRFISHLYSPPKRTRQAARPTIQIPDLDEYDLPHVESPTRGAQDYSEEQGYAKEMLNGWVSADGVGARKYDDLTAIGIVPQGRASG
jgi:hypothetical protein